ncbi:hypothetical protein B9Z55_008578 [Caenorhabditis nigoni]|uniref:SH2 domain-containing protein n=1 Tax=Caenorhabditis nigoni TaxID=1611254 RepID=A0A2G5UNC1_9PELO|nr:hypothetical protein B9Z55_008578 [Caenorhabditis nigoni]
MPSHSTNVRPASAQNPPRIDNNEVARNPETERAIARIQPEGSFSNAWFHGDSTKENADNLLKESIVGSFLAWKSSPTQFFLSILTTERNPHHIPIQRRDNGDLCVQNQVFKSLSEVVRNCPPAVYPIVTSGGPIQVSIPRNNNTNDNNSNDPAAVANRPAGGRANRVPRVRQTHQKTRTQAHKDLVQRTQQTGRFSRIRKLLSNETSNPPPPTAGQVPPTAPHGTTNNQAAENRPMLFLTVDPPACTVPAAGGTSVHKLVNGGEEKMIFKIKTTNNNEYRIFGFVDPSGSKDLTTTSAAGAPKEDRLVIYFAVVPAAATDAQAAVAAVTPAGTVTIPTYLPNLFFFWDNFPVPYKYPITFICKNEY